MPHAYDAAAVEVEIVAVSVDEVGSVGHHGVGRAVEEVAVERDDSDFEVDAGDVGVREAVAASARQRCEGCGRQCPKRAGCRRAVICG